MRPPFISTPTSVALLPLSTVLTGIPAHGANRNETHILISFGVARGSASEQTFFRETSFGS